MPENKSRGEAEAAEAFADWEKALPKENPVEGEPADKNRSREPLPFVGWQGDDLALVGWPV